ncbi:MAG: hypothetical protein MUF43_07865 [Flavobacterium sp.]|nr:hypothetical protein [Flavobacterium sp.]
MTINKTISFINKIFSAVLLTSIAVSNFVYAETVKENNQKISNFYTLNLSESVRENKLSISGENSEKVLKIVDEFSKIGQRNLAVLDKNNEASFIIDELAFYLATEKTNSNLFLTSVANIFSIHY